MATAPQKARATTDAHSGAVAGEHPGVHGSPPDATTTTPPAARRTPLARLLAALRGDKYMVDAYPVAESSPEVR